MKNLLRLTTLGLILFAASAASAQAPVVGVADPDALFTSPDPKLNENKQAAYHIVKDLLEANHWELADKYIATDYIQHNPQVASGRAAVVAYFTQTMKMKPTPIPVRMKTPLVSVVAENDYVVVAYVDPITDAKDPSKSYNATTYDMWRFKDGKAVEHWDVHTRDR